MRILKTVYFCALIGLFFTFSSTSLARVGVGVGTGKIQVDEEMVPGGIYELPSITVLNTGDETSQYAMSITYHEKQPELIPQEEWFTFSPAKFMLEPGQGQKVDITLTLPLSADPDNYFAYLEASPIQTAAEGSTSVGIAAASKLYFTVQPVNMLQGVFYRITSLWNLYQPWSNRIAIFLGVSSVLLITKRFVNFEVNLKKHENPKQ